MKTFVKVLEKGKAKHGKLERKTGNTKKLFLSRFFQKKQKNKFTKTVFVTKYDVQL